MTGEPRPHHDDIAELLSRASADPSLAPRHRAEVKAAVLAEFDSALAHTSTGDHSDAPVRATDLDPGIAPPTPERRSPSAWWAAVAAAGVLVVGLLAVTNARNEPAASDEPIPSTTVLGEPLPPATVSLDGLELPIDLADTRYRTDLLANGVEFRGQPGMQVIDLRPGRIVLDLGSGETAGQRRLSLFTADEDALTAVLDDAAERGYVSIDRAQFQVGDQPLPRRDLNVSATATSDLGCDAQEPCVPLVDDPSGEPIALWARSENFLIDLAIDDTPLYVLLQTQQFGDPILTAAFDIISTIRTGDTR